MCFFFLVKKPIVYNLRPGAVEESGIPQENIDEAQRVVAEAIFNGEIPGAALFVARKGVVVIEKGFGNAVVEPETIPMKANTMFDLASLTKPIATASSIMLLVQMKKISLNDKVSKYIPEFKGGYRDKIKIEHLLRHNSGIPSWDKYFVKFKNEVAPDKVIEDICNKPITVKPGTKTIYSDLGYILLGEIVRRVSGQTLDEFTKENIFRPLGMERTMFNPPEEMKKECAATEIVDSKLRWAEVHDGNATVMGGISGHAGLFSTVADLGIFMQMLLNGGKYYDKEIFESELVKKMVTPKGNKRRIGWGGCGAEHSSKKTIGHTGWTGTWIAADPEKDLIVILLTNRIHPKMKETESDHRKNIARLANRVFDAITADK